MKRRDVLRGAAGAAALGVAATAGGVTGRLTAPADDYPSREARELAAAFTGEQQSLGTRRVVWSVDTSEPAVAITFDDGPDPELTPLVLDALAAHGLHATFCCMGWNAERHRDLLRRVVDAGHEIANHGWSHLDLSQQPASSARSEVVRSHEALTRLTGTPPRWYRPARGELTGAALRSAAEVGSDLLLWTLLGDVAGVEEPETVAAYVDRHLAPGVVVSMHDGIGRGTFDRGGADAKALLQRRHAELAALPHILERGLGRGLRFVTATGLVALEQRA